MTVKKTLLKSMALFSAHKGDLLRAQGMTLAAWALCLCPLLFLCHAQLRLLALLCPILLLLLALPMRQSTAEAMQGFLDGMPMATVAMLPLNGYLTKLRRSLRMVGLMLLWCLPCLALLSVPVVLEVAEVDAVTLYLALANLGGGKPEPVIFAYVIAIVISLLLPLLGLAFHSGTRHAYALGNRKLLKHHRARLMGLLLAGLLFIFPVVVCLVALVAVMGVNVTQFILALMNDLTHFPSLSTLLPPTWLLVVTAISAVLMLLTNPARSLLPAIYLRAVRDESTEKEQEHAAP